MSVKKLIERRCMCVKSYHVDSTHNNTVVFEEGEQYSYYTTNNEFFLDPVDSGLVILKTDSFKYRFIDMIDYRNIQLNELIN